jgi:RIO kinase 1
LRGGDALCQGLQRSQQAQLSPGCRLRGRPQDKEQPQGARDEKGTRYGRKSQEEAWQSAEVDALYRLAASGVRVPTPYNFCEGVLLMELVTDSDGNPAPRLNDVDLSAEEARKHHHTLMTEVVRMLCAGVVHGDLSEYNVLLASTGPVIIDLPQAVDAAGNNHANRMLERDVGNLTSYFGRFAPELLTTTYAKEIWSLYQDGTLQPDVRLTGFFQQSLQPVDLDGVVLAIDDARAEDAARRLRQRPDFDPLKDLVQ